MGSALLVLLIYYLVRGWHLGNFWEQKNLQRIWFALYFIRRIIFKYNFFLSPFFFFFYQGMRGSQSFGESWKGRVGWVWCEAKSLQQGWQTFCKGPDNKFSLMAVWSLLHLLYRVANTERNGQGCVPIRLDVQQGWAWPTGCSLPTPAGVWRQRARTGAHTKTKGGEK